MTQILNRVAVHELATTQQRAVNALLQLGGFVQTEADPTNLLWPIREANRLIP